MKPAVAVCAIFLVIGCASAALATEQDLLMDLKETFKHADQVNEIAEEESGKTH